MRGKVQVGIKIAVTIGITPAYAGKSLHKQGWEARLWDHPRLCGEKGTFGVDTSTTTGITPAYAGKRPLYTPSSYMCKDHPRLCGEKDQRYNWTLQDLGSPPPMRGKATAPPRRSIPHRITPAYAGKRFRKMMRLRLAGDHPRLCGEKLSHRRVYFPRLGSPPPMRGKD